MPLRLSRKKFSGLVLRLDSPSWKFSSSFASAIDVVYQEMRGRAVVVHREQIMNVKNCERSAVTTPLQRLMLDMSLFMT